MKQLNNRCIIIKQKFIFLIVECARRFLEVQQKTTKQKINMKKKLNHRKASNIIESHLIILRYRFLIGNEKNKQQNFINIFVEFSATRFGYFSFLSSF
jgi:hypothetical protein